MTKEDRKIRVKIWGDEDAWMPVRDIFNANIISGFLLVKDVDLNQEDGTAMVEVNDRYQFILPKVMIDPKTGEEKAELIEVQADLDPEESKVKIWNSVLKHLATVNRVTVIDEM